jgi:hypothetical protein
MSLLASFHGGANLEFDLRRAKHEARTPGRVNDESDSWDDHFTRWFVTDHSGKPARLYPDLMTLQGSSCMNAAIEPKHDDHFYFTLVTHGIEAAIAQSKAAHTSSSTT